MQLLYPEEYVMRRSVLGRGVPILREQEALAS